MEKDVFKVLINNVKGTKEMTVTTHSLYEIIEQFINNNDIALVIMKSSNKSGKKEIQKYYKSQYSLFYRRHKLNQINEKQYLEVCNKLKKLKEESNTKEDFKKKFEKYKKANNIPSYNVSKK